MAFEQFDIDTRARTVSRCQQVCAGSRAAGQSNLKPCPARSKQKTLAMLGCLGAAEALHNQLLSPAHKPQLELLCSSLRWGDDPLMGPPAADGCCCGPCGLWRTSYPCSHLTSRNEIENQKFVLIELSVSEAES